MNSSPAGTALRAELGEQTVGNSTPENGRRGACHPDGWALSRREISRVAASLLPICIKAAIAGMCLARERAWDVNDDAKHARLHRLSSRAARSR